MVSNLAIYEEMPTEQLAEVMFKSGLFSDMKSMAQAIVKVIAGRELGIGPVAAMRGIDIIQGKVALSASLTAALVKQTGRYTFYTVQHDDKICSIEFHERIDGAWQPIGTSTFTIAMAKRANLEGKDVWKNYPEAMLWARAMTQGAGWFCPDATEGRFYSPEELGADRLDEDHQNSEAGDSPENPLSPVGVAPDPASEHMSEAEATSHAGGTGKAAQAETGTSASDTSTGPATRKPHAYEGDGTEPCRARSCGWAAEHPVHGKAA